jgi:hypothetical protein
MIAEGSVITGHGQVIRKDGTKVDIILTSDPLTKEQAEAFSKQQEIENGSHSR